MSANAGLLERLETGTVFCAEGYVFELERWGYIQAGPYVPEVVLDAPDISLHPALGSGVQQRDKLYLADWRDREGVDRTRP